MSTPDPDFDFPADGPLLTPDFGAPAARSSRILIVDDMEPNREILHDLTVALGYWPLLAGNGKEALARLEQEPVDLILLDILMPEMNGYETLARLKEHPEWRYLPVIVISAVDETDSVVRCLQMGAEDYLAKPFNAILLKARINACLERKYLRDQEEAHRRQIEDYGLQLEGMVYEKTQQLADAYEKLKRLDHAKNEFLRIISHELRTPLHGLTGAAEMLFKHPSGDPAEGEVMRIFQASLERFAEFVNQAQLLTRLDLFDENLPKGKSQCCALLESALAASLPFAQSRGVAFKAVAPCENGLVNGEETMLIQALAALLKTAVKFSKGNQPVEYLCRARESGAALEIHAHGWRIPDKFVGSFFTLFSITDSIIPGGDLGLAPPVAARILELYGGGVTVANLEPAGIVFRVNLQAIAP